MNTTALKKFAQNARTKLISEIGNRLAQILEVDSIEQREKRTPIKALQTEILRIGKEAVIDKVAYTWFNRLMAFRFMDANEFSETQVLSGDQGAPQILKDAQAGIIDAELGVDSERINDLLLEKISSTNPQNEVYKMLLIGECHRWHKIMPFIFQPIDDYTELLLPNDMTSGRSIVADIVAGMSQEDCQDVEIIGWLYQFYISERKDELINAKKRYKADEIAPVTQLFTPKWIVQYMVDNTLGQLWKEARPNTTITNGLEFYIKPNNPELIPSRDIKSVEDITFFDPCVGSAHVLCYAYDIFYKMYEEEGYNPSDISELIITKNLYGIDIDDRAGQLASFALMMKGRKNQRRFFRKNIAPNITAFQNIESHPKFENAKVLGSLIKITKDEVEEITVDETSLFVERDIQLKKQASLLANKYDIVVTNPPYLNSSYMEETLKQFVEKEYKTTKSDLFACFLVQVSNFTKEDGFIGFICPYVWMFINSYEWIREYIIENSTITNLVQLEYNAFGPAVVPICSFTLRNEFLNKYNGSYIKLSEFTGAENQAPRTLQAINNKDCGWFYSAYQKDFEKISGSPYGYWLSKRTIEIFEDSDTIENISAPKQGLITGNNERFVRLWQECEWNKKSVKWFPFNKGGAIRKWYGNQLHFVNWKNNGQDLLNFTDTNGKLRSRPQNISSYFKRSISWTKIGSSDFTVRYYNEEFIFSDAGLASFPNDNDIMYLLGLLNTKIVGALVSALNPTLNRNIGDINKIPVIRDCSDISVINFVQNCVEIAVYDWNSKETSWDFTENELIRIKGQDLEETYDLYQQYWKNKFFQLHKNEEELNKQFIDIYGLQEELTPDVPLKDITILKEETDIENGELVFDAQEVFAQFMSYAVGCMFGRYSIDKDGLILANQGETLEDYFKKVEKSEDAVSFLPDDDNIIPILDDEWFEDDIVGRFYKFIKVTFGTTNFEKNLAFVEECLGKDIRKYFVRDFYKDHIKRYKKRPTYWMFSSPKGAFNVLIYMHRYTPDTCSTILHDYLKPYVAKLTNHLSHLENQLTTSGLSASERNKLLKKKSITEAAIKDCVNYERDILLDIAQGRIQLDLDDGVLVNYNKMGKAVQKVAGLNDAKTKKKVSGFDWIDTSLILD